MSLDFSGLDKFSDLVGKPRKSPAAMGGPAVIPLDRIVEDPGQPRKVFCEEAMAELTASVQARGIKTPISVHVDPDDPKRYIINHGARRYRAACAAGLTEIPAIVDADHDAIDQLAENIQREKLTLPEIINGVAALIDDGVSQTAIAKALGKQASWVSQIARLSNLPPALQAVMEDGGCQDRHAMLLLLRAWQTDGAMAEEQLHHHTGHISRAEAQGILDAIDRKARPDEPATTTSSENTTDHDQQGLTEPNPDTEPSANDGTTKPSKPAGAKPRIDPRVLVTVAGREAVLELLPCKTYGEVTVTYKDGEQCQVQADDLALVAVVNAAAE